MLTKLHKSTKIGLVVVFLITGFVIFSNSAIGQRLNLPSNLAQSVWGFLAGNNLHACDYKDGMIILVKPIATGEGLGRYEAGDIVEIRDGALICNTYGDRDPLGKEEKTQLLPLYYPAKLSQEEIQELTKSEFQIPNDKSQTNDSISKSKIVKRRKVGLDYTKFLNDSEVLKVRDYKSLNRLPEIDLSSVKEKTSQELSVILESQIKTSVVKNPLANAKEKIKNFFATVAYAASYSKIVDPNNGPGTSYLSLNAWEAGEQGLYSSGDEAIADCRRTGALKDTTAVTISGWTAGVIPKIIVNPAYRHEGKWTDQRSDGKYAYILDVTNTDALFSQLSLSILYLQVHTTVTSEYTFGRGIQVSASGLTADGVIVWNHSDYNNAYLGGISANGDNNKIRNCMVWRTGNSSPGGGDGTGGIRIDWGYNNNQIHNSTVLGYHMNGIYGNYATLEVKNCFAAGSYIQDFKFDSSTVTGDYNVSSDTTAIGTHKAINKTAYTNYFVDSTNGDFHLKNTSSSLWGLVGTNLGSIFKTDIDGRARTDAWDIGADQYDGPVIKTGPTNGGLVGHWKFDEGAGTKATDSSGNGNTGTLVGASTGWVNGKLGKAVNSPDWNTYISVNESASLNSTDTNVTISAWVKISSGYQPSIYNVNAYTAGINSNNKFYFGHTSIESNTVIDANWHFLSAVKSGNSGTNITLYVDGVPDGQGAYSTGAVSGAVSIGGLGGYKFGGLIDDVRIYNRALSAEEIAGLYKEGAVRVSAPTDKGLVGYWKFDEGVGTKATDSSGRGNIGSITGATWTSGKLGKGLSFDGKNLTSVSISNNSSISTLPKMTASAWVNFKSFTNNDADLQNTIIGKGFHLYVDNNGKLFFSVPTDNVYATVESSQNLIINKWYHIVAIHDGIGIFPKIYINGVDVSLNQYGGSGTQANDSGWSLMIGAASTNNYAYNSNAIIDDVRIYNRALTASEIQTLYQSGATQVR